MQTLGGNATPVRRPGLRWRSLTRDKAISDFVRTAEVSLDAVRLAEDSKHASSSKAYFHTAARFNPKKIQVVARPSIGCFDFFAKKN